MTKQRRNKGIRRNSKTHKMKDTEIEESTCLPLMTEGGMAGTASIEVITLDDSAVEEDRTKGGESPPLEGEADDSCFYYIDKTPDTGRCAKRKSDADETPLYDKKRRIEVARQSVTEAAEDGGSLVPEPEAYSPFVKPGPFGESKETVVLDDTIEVVESDDDDDDIKIIEHDYTTIVVSDEEDGEERPPRPCDVLQVLNRESRGMTKAQKKALRKKLKNSLNKLVDSVASLGDGDPRRGNKGKQGAQTSPPKLRPVVIDGSNVAFGHDRTGRFSSRGLKICVDYFRKRGHKVIVFIPQFRRRHPMTMDYHLLDELETQGIVVFTPSRHVNGVRVVPYDDRYIVEYAHEMGGVIVSRDNYRDLILQNPEWKSTIDNRLLMYTWADDMIMFPQDPMGRCGPNLSEFLSFT